MESTYKINPKRFVYDTKMIIDEKLCKYTRKQLGRYKSGISITFTTYYLRDSKHPPGCFSLRGTQNTKTNTHTHTHTLKNNYEKKPLL